jgi:hypothetical protein
VTEIHAAQLAPTVDRPHGYARYKLDGCRCNLCGFAVSEYTRLRRNAIRKGTWRVDAEQVRAHVRALQAAGMGRHRIAAVAGMNDSTLSNLLYGRGGRPVPATMRYDLAQKLLAVAPDLAPYARISGVGTVRRVRALVAIGWTLTEIAAGVGWSVANLCDLVSGRTAGVAVRTARLVAGLYERLSMTPSTGPRAGRARSMARSRGWVPPLGWNEGAIDNPSARPRGIPSTDGEVAS